MVVTLEGRNIMFDTGMHMGYNDERRFPDFSLLSPTRDFDAVIDAVIITHLYGRVCGAGLTMALATWTTAARCRTLPKCAGTAGRSS